MLECPMRWRAGGQKGKFIGGQGWVRGSQMRLKVPAGMISKFAVTGVNNFFIVVRGGAHKICFSGPLALPFSERPTLSMSFPL